MLSTSVTNHPSVLGMERFFKSCIFSLVEASCLECGIAGNIKAAAEVFPVGIVSLHAANTYYSL